MYRRVDLWLVEAAESEAHPHPVGEMVETPVAADRMVVSDRMVTSFAAFVGHDYTPVD